MPISTIKTGKMEQIKSILIVGLVLIAVALYYKPAVYEPPVYVEIPALIDDSTRAVIISSAKRDSVVVRYIDRVRWTTKDSLRIQDSIQIVRLPYVSILTDSAEYRLSRLDSTLGVGFSLKIGLADTVILEPFDTFIHDFWLDSLVWKVEKQPEVKPLNWLEWVMAYPDKVAITALVAMIIGKL